jgi:hypothetical protein
VVANVDPDVVARAEKLVWELLQEIDREQAQVGNR